MIANFGVLLVPLYVGKSVDLMQNDESVNMLCIELMIIVVITGIFTGFRGFIFNLMSERIARRVRMELYTSILNKDIPFFDT